jgi:hypothetical protein
MTVTPWLANYPWTDPIFQNFEVQQYLSVSGVNPAQTYDLDAPGIVNKERDKAASDKAIAETAAKAKADAEAAEANKLEEARKLVAEADAKTKAPARKTAASKDSK